MWPPVKHKLFPGRHIVYDNVHRGGRYCSLSMGSEGGGCWLVGNQLLWKGAAVLWGAEFSVCQDHLMQITEPALAVHVLLKVGE